MSTKVLELYNIERKLFWILSVLLVSLVAFYLYSILSIAVAGVERDQTMKNTRTLTLKVGGLEEEYMGIQNSITMAHAEELGFHEVAPKFAGSVTQGTGAKISMAR